MKTHLWCVAFVLLVLPFLTGCGQDSATAEATAIVAPAEVTVAVEPTGESQVVYQVVDTGQTTCYNDTVGIECPGAGEAFSGQDAQYAGAQPRYVDNGDGTVTDMNTGLMWQQDPGAKVTYLEAVSGAEALELAGHADWRLPTIKELYSLIVFSGVDPSGQETEESAVPFIDTDYFIFQYGGANAGERLIDAQFWSSTGYVATTMRDAATVFGVNFADGRIKGYPRDIGGRGTPMTEFVRYVRGNPDYGVNDLVDNGDGTITDRATGLMWMQADSGAGLDWEEALAYCERLEHAGHDDWRLPNAKELQSIVDYTRSPKTTSSAALDPIFEATSIVDEAGNTDYPCYWSSTTHRHRVFAGAVYVAFGEAMGYMGGHWIDVHGAGAQRSDPKSGDPADYPTGHGPQGDAIRIFNYARCVRGGVAGGLFTGGEVDPLAGSGSREPGGQMGQPGGPPREPPQEAIDACAGASEGAACEFMAPHGKVTGTCRQVPGYFACVP